MSITGVLPPGRALDAPVMDIVSLHLSPPPQWVRSGAAAGDRDGRRDKLDCHGCTCCFPRPTVKLLCPSHRTDVPVDVQVA